MVAHAVNVAKSAIRVVEHAKLKLFVELDLDETVEEAAAAALAAIMKTVRV